MQSYQIDILNHIQHALHKLESQESNQITLFTDSDDNDDSGDEDPNLEEDIDNPPSQVANIVALNQSKFEEKALTSFLGGFDFKDYSPDLIIELSGYLLDFLISSIQKEVVGQFDHELITFHTIYAMDFEAKSFKSPGLISQAYSAMIYIFQLIVVEASSIGKGMYYTSISYPLVYLILLYILSSSISYPLVYLILSDHIYYTK